MILNKIAFNIGRLEGLANIAYNRGRLNRVRALRLNILKLSKQWQDESYKVSGRDLICPVISSVRSTLLTGRQKHYELGLISVSNKYSKPHKNK